MVKIFSVTIIALLILLSPPAVLAFISQDAIPGDATYPIKRKLEDGIVLIASLNPTTKALFAVNRSDRRFKEASVLLEKGKMPEQTLEELVSQTSEAVTDTTQIEDVTQKTRAIDKLSKSIDKYNQKLSEQSKQSTSAPTNQSIQTPTPKTTPEPILKNMPPSDKPNPNQKSLEEYLRQLEELRKKLEAEKANLSVQSNSPNSTPSPQNQPSLSPTPTSSETPLPVITPSPTPVASEVPPAIARNSKKFSAERESQVDPKNGNYCRDNPTDAPESGSKEFSYYWNSQCSQSCLTNNDCPKNTSDPAVNPDSSAWCYHFDEGNRCLMLEAKRP